MKYFKIFICLCSCVLNRNGKNKLKQRNRKMFYEGGICPPSFAVKGGLTH